MLALVPLRNPIKPVYKHDSQGEWRWTLEASNGRILDASSEGFSSKSNAKRNFRMVAENGIRLNLPSPQYLAQVWQNNLNDESPQWHELSSYDQTHLTLTAGRVIDYLWPTRIK
jgi:uncharacterized protein YegP (UPF0339 family)